MVLEKNWGNRAKLALESNVTYNQVGNGPGVNVLVEEEENLELRNMRRRFWVALVLTIPEVVIAMSHLIPGHPLQRLASSHFWGWVGLGFATPVVLWCGWPFFVRGVQSVINRSLNMFTLIGLGVSVAYIFSLVAKIFPASFRNASGDVGVYFEAAAFIVTLVLLGQVLELKARSSVVGNALRLRRLTL